MRSSMYKALCNFLSYSEELASYFVLRYIAPITAERKVIENEHFTGTTNEYIVLCCHKLEKHLDRNEIKLVYGFYRKC